MTIGILSWKSHLTLAHTLESYRRFGLDKMDDEKIIFFQEIDDIDREIADDYGYKAVGIPINIGIASGYKSLVELATGDLFLFLENDWELIGPPQEILYDAAERLRNGVVDVCRLRHTEHYGEPLWSKQYKGQEMAHPTFLLDSCYWEPNPDKFWPIEKQEDWYVTTAPFANWTNNPTMFRTEWVKKIIGPRMGNIDVEKDIQYWWEQQKDITVAQAIPGLFTHNRLDR